METKNKRLNRVLFSSDNEVWETPIELFKELDKEFNFNLDPCAIPENAKCNKYFTPDQDGLKQCWQGYTVFCNPPYGRKINEWVKKCYDESKKDNTTVVMLIPSRTDTRYFHDYIYDHKSNKFKVKECRFIKGRLRFGSATENAPLPSMIVVF